MKRHVTIVAFAIVVLRLASSPAAAQSVLDEGRTEFSLGIGYANLSLGSETAIDDEGALRFEPSLNFSPFGEKLPQLRLGFNAGVSMVLDNSSRTIIINNGTAIFRGSSDVPLWTIEPELRLSWRQTFGSDHQFFIEPGVAGGAAFGWLSLDDEVTGDSFDSDASTTYGRAFLRIGAQAEGGAAGFEFSYLSGGKMDFGGNASGDLREWYIGFFGALLF